MGWILAEYGTKRSHGDLIQTIFHVFGLKNLVLSSLCTRHREADAGRAGGFAESLDLLVLIPLNIHTPKIATLPLQGDNLGSDAHSCYIAWFHIGFLGPQNHGF